MPISVLFAFRKASSALLRINAVFQEFTRLECHGVARLDFHRLAGLWIFTRACAAMALQESTEANQGHTVLLVKGIGDFVQDGIEYAIGLFLGEICFLSNSGCELWFKQMKPLLRFFVFMSRAALAGQRAGAATALRSGRPE
jgi:hypothetical protein